jgi:hypothetical protein
MELLSEQTPEPSPRSGDEWTPGWIVAVALVTVLALGLAGYWTWDRYIRTDSSTSSEDPDDPGTTDYPTSTAEARPMLPNAASELSTDGVEAAVRFEYQALNYAQRTGDFYPMTTIEADVCGFCADLRNGLQANLANGRSIRGGEYVVTRIEERVYLRDDRQEDIGSITLDVSRSPEEYVEADGTVISTEDAKSGSFKFTLVHDGTHWVVNNIVLVAIK